MAKGGARIGAGRKSGIGVSCEIKRHCEKFITELLQNDLVRNKAVQQLSLLEHEPARGEGVIYILKSNGLYKIGFTSNLTKRLKNYRNHGTTEVIYILQSIHAFDLEILVHNHFQGNIKRGEEWYHFTDTELISVISYLSNQIISNGWD